MNIYELDANLVLSLDALLREGSVTRAAQSVGLTQSAMSHALGRLREQLGDPLLVRAGRRMVLTERARSIAPRVSLIVSEMIDVFRADYPADLPEGIRFTLSVEDAALAMIPAFERVLTEPTSVGLDFVPGLSTNEEVERLRTTTHVAIGCFDDLPPDIKQQHVMTDRIVVIASFQNEMAYDMTRTTYCALPHVVTGTPASRRGLRDRIIARAVPTFAIAAQVVAETTMIAAMPESTADWMAEHLPLRVYDLPMGDNDPITISMAWHDRYHRDPAHRWLRDMILRAAGSV